MRVIPLACAISLLSACSEPAENIDDTRKTVRNTAGALDYFVMGPGFYDIEGGEGVIYGSTELKSDGTYVDLAGDKEVGGGTWSGEGQHICFDPQGDDEDQQERCWTNSPLSDDGSFVTTRDDGSQSYTVRPRDTD